MKEHMTWHNCFSSVRAWFCSVHEKRSYNTLRYPMTNRLLLILYPIFIVCMAELNQDKYPSKWYCSSPIIPPSCCLTC